jgi:hypothetical protein
VLCCSQRHGGIRSDVRKRNILLQVRAEGPVAIEGELTLLLGQLGQRRTVRGVTWRGCHASDYAR